MIEREDVLQVANSLNIELTKEQINEVIMQYPSEAENDPSATWDLIVENIIYNIKK